VSAGAGGTSVDATAGTMRERAVRGVFWTAVEKWSVRLSTFVGFIILGNLLSPADFGVVALAMTFIAILTTVADAGFSNYLLQLRRLTDAATSTAFYTTSAMALLLAGCLTGFAGLIGAGLDTPALAQVLPALAVSLLIAGLSSVPAMLLRRELRFKELALRQVTAAVLSIVVAVVLALAGAGVWALVGQTLVRSVVSLVVLWGITTFRPRRLFDRAEARVMTVYGVQSLGAQLSNQLRSQGEIFLIGALAGPAALGYWTIASRLVSVVVDTLTSVIDTVALPVFARLQDDGLRLARALGTASAVSAFVVAPALVALSLVSGEVVPAVFGDQWAMSAVLASLMAVRALLRTLTTMNAAVLLGTGHPRPELVLNFSTLVIQLGLVALLVDDLELLAAALSVAVALTIPIRLLLVRRLLGVPASTYRGTAGVLLAAGVAVAVVLGAQQLLQVQGAAYVGLVIALGGAVYAGMALVVCRPVVREVAAVFGSVLTRRRKPATQPA
jgi:O-antigen/teichoic acid export membrane protein